MPVNQVNTLHLGEIRSLLPQAIPGYLQEEILVNDDF